MKITNWERIVRKLDDLTDAGIYIMYDDTGECLYIGMSQNVEDRLLIHLFGSDRTRTSSVGRFVLRHKQQSRMWPLVVVEPEDCAAIHNEQMARFWKDETPSRSFDADKFRHDRGTRERIETFLIAHLTPIFNMTLNNGKRPKPLTDAQQNYYFALECSPEKSSSFYLNI